jgi:pteridine reductase
MPTPETSHCVKVAIISGGAIRVGRAIAQELASTGYRVWIHYHRSRERAHELVEDLRLSFGNDIVAGTVGGDLSRSDVRKRISDAVVDPNGPCGGRLDLLVNNAASFEYGRFADRSDADLRRVLETNLVAPLSLARHFTPALTRAAGNIINIADIGGIHPWRGYLDHCVSKAGLIAATQALAIELAPIRVNAIAPGTVDWPDDVRYAPGSAAREQIVAQIPLGTIGDPRHVATAVSFLAAAPHINGICLPIDGGRLAAIAHERGHERD